MTTAGEFCNRWVVFVHREEPAQVAVEQMRAHHVGAVVVVEELDGALHPVGMLTDRDLVMQLLVPDAPGPEAISVGQLVKRDLVRARETESLDDVVHRMRAHGVRRIPVVDGHGVLQGIIALDDVVGFVASQLGALSELIDREQRYEGGTDAAR